MGAGTQLRSPLMARDLDDDGQVCWWALGEIARTNGSGLWEPWTADDLYEWDNEHWDQLAADTPQLNGPMTTAQRVLVVAVLRDLEAEDAHHADRWWER